MSRSKKNRAPSAPTPPSGSSIAPAAVAFDSAGMVAPSSVAVAEPAAPDADELFWESHVAARLGVSREKISALREAHLTPGDHFVMRGNAIVLTPSGLARLEVALSSPIPAEDSAPAVSTLADDASLATANTQPAPHLPAPPPLAPALAAVACQPERLRVVVVRQLANRHLIFVRPAIREPKTSATTPAFLCRVKDNAHFHPRLAPFDIRRAADGQWLYLGRLPRSLGRW